MPGNCESGIGKMPVRFLGTIVLMIFNLTMGTSWGRDLVLESPSGPYKMYEQSFALLVGVSNYKNEATWPELKMVPDEIKIVKAALIEQGFEIQELPDPTISELTIALKLFLSKKVKIDTRLVIYIAAHGYSDDRNLGFIIPTDGVEPSSDEFIASVISMSEIKEWSVQTRAKHVLMVFNSCFSGSVFLTRSGLRPSKLFLKDIDRLGRQYLTSGSATEQVPDRLDFANSFVGGIMGDADITEDGIVTAFELGYFIRGAITPLGMQTPQFGSDPRTEYRGGDLVFEATSEIGRENRKSNLRISNDLGTGPRVASVRALGEPSKPGGQLFAGLEVLYYERLADDGRVRGALNASGIPFVTTLAERADETGVDTIACGPDVSGDALRELARTLVENGVGIRQIVRFRKPEEKLRRIEVLSMLRSPLGNGRDNLPVLSLEKIESIKACPAA